MKLLAFIFLLNRNLNIKYDFANVLMQISAPITVFKFSFICTTSDVYLFTECGISVSCFQQFQVG